MTTTPFMQLYVGDYLSDTLHLTTEQHGAYMLLLMTMWRAGAELPNDPAKLARICRVSPKRWPSVWAEIEGFFTVDGGVIRNARLTKEHQKAVSISQERKTAGKKGGEAKALKDKEAALANAKAGLQHSQKSEPYKEDTDVSSLPRKRATRLSPEWFLPSDWGDWAISEGWPESVIRAEAAKFKDYWTSKAGRDAAKMDWGATFRNWMRNCKAPKVHSGDGYVGTAKSTDRLRAFIGGAD
jgi:uncharacterized protein YdaU (DUF1376 family)